MLLPGYTYVKRANEAKGQHVTLIEKLVETIVDTGGLNMSGQRREMAKNIMYFYERHELRHTFKNFIKTYRRVDIK